MADMHEIEFGGQSIRVPKWASEEQLNRVIDLDKDNNALLKNLFTANKQSFKTLDAMLKAQERMPSKISRENTKVIKDLEAAVEDVANAVGKSGDKQNKQSEKRGKQDLKEALKFRQAYKDLSRDLGKHFNSLGSNFKDGIKGIAGGDFEGFAKAAGGIVGLGAVAGFAAKSTVTFANNLSQLTNVGSGFGVGLVDLRSTAALAGTGLEGLAKIAQANAMTFKALGSNTTEGMMAFARLSNQIRQSGTQMGLTNTEFNDLLSEEIELRRSAGQTERQISQGVNNSFRNLVQETTALASITGADRREMLRARTELADDPGLRRFAASTPQLNGVVSIFSALGPLGKDLSTQLLRSARGQEKFSIFQGNLGGELADTFARLGPNAQQLLQEIDGLVNSAVNIDPNDTAALDELNTTLISKVVALKDSVPESTLRMLEDRVNNLGDSADEQDKQSLNFVSALVGINGEQEALLKGIKKQRETMDDDTFVDLSATIEDTSNKLKAAGMEAFMDLTGAERDDGKGLVTAIDKLGENVMRDGLLGGILTSLGDANGTLKLILGAIVGVGAALTLGPLAMLGRGGFMAGRKLFQGAKNVVKATPGVVKKAPAAANTVKNTAKTVANVAKDATKNVAKSTAVVTAKETAEKVGKSVAKQVAETSAKSVGKSIAKKIPGVSIIAGLAFGLDRLLEGDFLGAAGEVGSGIAGTIPVAGTAASVVIDAGLLARDIAKVYEKEGLDPEEAKRRASADAMNLKIAEAQDRIKRSEDGENVYWGRESKGIAEDQANIQALMLAEIKRLNELQAAGNTLTEKEAEQLAQMKESLEKIKSKDILKTMGTEDGQGLVAQSYKEAVALGNNLQKSFADQVDSVNIREQLDENGEATGKYIVSALNERQMTAEERTRNPELAKFNEGKMSERINLSELNLSKLTDTAAKEVKEALTKGATSLPSDKVLAQHKTIAATQRKANELKAAIEAEYGEAKAIGVNEEQKQSLLDSGIAGTDEEATKMATIYGYEDEDINKKYQHAKTISNRAENQLRKIERDPRYRAARGREVGRAMGIIDENEYNVKGTFVGGAPTNINGVAVADEFLTDRERGNKQAATNLRNEMNNLRNPVSTQIQTETQSESSSSDNQSLSTGNPNEDMLRELRETNRLLKQQTDAIESN
tara:strand:- start:4641 stop:8123 length:3483 start_codon:yes stop_codon:yes gene_type:complete